MGFDLVLTGAAGAQALDSGPASDPGGSNPICWRSLQIATETGLMSILAQRSLLAYRGIRVRLGNEGLRVGAVA